jgi:hypothetical protein
VEGLSQRNRRFVARQFPENTKRLRLRIKRRLRAETGKLGARDKLPEGCFGFNGELTVLHRVFTRNTR